MTICGVEITGRVRAAMLTVAVTVEGRIGRRLDTPEMDLIIMAVVRHLVDEAERRRTGVSPRASRLN